LQTNSQHKIVFTGGGSGGHLNAAIAVIKEFQAHPQQYPAELVYVGGTRGMINDPTPSLESRKIPELGPRFISIRSGKLQRYLSVDSIKLLAGVFGGFIDAWKVLKTEKPALVFSTGGYVTVPVVICARLQGIPVVIHEQTIVSGLANRINAQFADKILVSFANSLQYFPASKTIVSGNPLQASRFQTDLPASVGADYKEKLEQFVAEKPTRPFIFITGGGLGSHKLNNWLKNNLEALTSKYNLLLQTGENQVYKDFETIQIHLQTAAPALREHLFVIKWFADEIGHIYNQADLVISRPGANSVLELLATNRRAIFIPIPWSANNEQQLNAEYFCQQQAGAIVAEAELAVKLLAQIPQVLQMSARDSSKLVDKTAAVKIAQLLWQTTLSSN